MARRRSTGRKSTRRSTGGNYGRSTRRSTARRYGSRTATRSRSRKTAPRQQRIVIEFAGASPVREGGLGITTKPAPAARLKPRF